MGQGSGGESLSLLRTVQLQRVGRLAAVVSGALYGWGCTLGRKGGGMARPHLCFMGVPSVGIPRAEDQCKPNIMASLSTDTNGL